MTTSITVPRMYSDAMGERRFDSYDVPLTLQDAAPPAAPFCTSAQLTRRATSFAFHPAGSAICIPRGTQGS